MLRDLTQGGGLAQVIDINYYPVPQAKTSNSKHRPVGIGIQVSDTKGAFGACQKLPFKNCLSETAFQKQ